MLSRPTASFASLVTLLLLFASWPLAGAASVDLRHAGGGVAFTFSNGYASAPSAAQILEDHGFVGTFYVGSGTLRQGPYYSAFVSAQDVTNLSGRGHEIGSMTVSQRDLTTLPDATMRSELTDSRSALASLAGKPVTQLAYPFGAVNATVAAAAASTYAGARIVVGDPSEAASSADAYHLPGVIVTRSTSLATAKGYVDYAVANNVYVILAFGDVTATPDAYGWTPSDLESLVAYVASRSVAVSTMSQVVAGASAPPPTTPCAPTLGAQAGNGSVVLSWTTPCNGGSALTGYKIYRATDGGPQALYRTVGVQNSFVDANATNGLLHRYQVSATNALGEGNRSAEASVTPGAGVPSGARIVFTFDNGYASGVAASQILEARGFRGTFFASSALLRQGAFYTDYMSGADLSGLATRGHEIGSMTVDQKDLTTLTSAQVNAELSDSQAALEGITGVPVRSLAYPYGAVNGAVASATASRYDAARTITGSVNDFASAPIDAYHVPGLVIQKSTSLATAQSYVDFAIARNTSVTLEFSRITTTPGTYDWTPSDLDALAGYVQGKGVPVVTFAQRVAGTPPPPVGAPKAPSLSVIAGNAAVNLSWTTPDNNGSPITGYKVYRGSTSGGEALIATLGVQNAYRDFPVNNSATYYYQVTALNAKGESARSNEAVAVPNATGVPSGAAIVFTFDDGLRSQLTAKPTLDQLGIKATFFVNSGVLRANGDNPESMSSAEVKMLAMGGQDIESHMQFHDDATTLSASALDAELKNAQTQLRAITGQPTNYLAWPYGAHNAATDAAAAKYYGASRTYNSDLSIATAHSTAKFGVPAMGVFSTDSAAKIDGYVDYAITHNVTVILVIHNLAPVPKSYGVQLDNYDWNLAAFQSVASYTVAHHVPVKTIAQLGAEGRLPPN